MALHAAWRHGHWQVGGSVEGTVPEQLRDDPVQLVIGVAEAGLEDLVHKKSALVKRKVLAL